MNINIICTLLEIVEVPPLPPARFDENCEERRPFLFQHPEGRPGFSPDQGIQCRIGEFAKSRNGTLPRIKKGLEKIGEITPRGINRKIGMIIQITPRGKILGIESAPCILPSVRDPLPQGTLYPNEKNRFVILVINRERQVITALEVGTNTHELKLGDMAKRLKTLNPAVQEKLSSSRIPHPEFQLPQGIGFRKGTRLLEIATLLKYLYLACYPQDWAGSWKPIEDIGINIPRNRNRPLKQVKFQGVAKARPRVMRINIPTSGNENLLKVIKKLVRITKIEEERWRRNRIYTKFGRLIDNLLEDYVYYHYEKGHEAKGVKAALQIIENCYEYIHKSPGHFGLLIRNGHLLNLLRDRDIISEKRWMEYSNGEHELPPLPKLSAYEQKVSETINVKMLQPVNGIQPVDIYYHPKEGWKIDQNGRGMYRYRLFAGIIFEEENSPSEEEDEFLF
ncbi:hypothetical protein ACFLZS_01900 [Patescibacteria group bacterium]